MGKTQPTYRQRVTDFVDDWERFRRALRLEDQALFDRVTERMQKQAMAGGAQNPHDPRWGMVMAVFVEQERDIQDLQDRVTALEPRLEEPGTQPDADPA